MGVNQTLRKIQRGFRYRSKFGSGEWASLLEEMDFPLDVRAQVDPQKGIRLDGLGVWLPHGTKAGLILCWGYANAARMRRDSGANFQISEQDELFVEIGGMRLRIGSQTDLDTCLEVFCQELYGFAFPSPFVVMDIGMNVGYASLFFASKFDCEVYSYELVPSTFVQADANIGLNPSVDGRIHRHAYGLGKTEAEFELAMDDRVSASIGLHGVAEAMGSKPTGTVKVSVKAASAELRGIVDRNPGLPVAIKLDCEGAEYDILESLIESGLLSHVALIFGEWHAIEGHGLEQIVGLLRTAGFSVYYERHHHFSHVGMFHAFRPAGR